LIPAIYPDGIPGAVPTSPAMSRDNVETPAKGGDEVLNPALKPIATVAAFAVALSASSALTSQTPDRGLGDPCITAQPKTSATKRRPGLLSRWMSLYLGRRA
jgi:hypothetical protein